MKPPVIEYRTLSGPGLTATWSLRRILVISVLVAGLVGLGMHGCTTERRMDAVTGSWSERTTGPLGVPLGTRMGVSALEERLRRMGATWQADWRFTSDERFSLLDMRRGCGSEPEISELRSVMKEFVEASTDQETREFVTVMQVGTQAEQRAAVEKALERINDQ
jgi:hypothetical protein